MENLSEPTNDVDGAPVQCVVPRPAPAITPYYDMDGITIYHGDNREIIPSLDRVDCLLTDPPYGIVNQFGTQVSQPGKGTRTLEFDWDDPDVTAAVVNAVSLSLQLVDPKGSAFCFCGGDQFGVIMATIRAHGFIAKPAVWLKQCPPPPGKGNWWPSGFEFAVYGYRSGAFFGDTDPKRCNVFTYDSYRHGKPGKVDHPTQKPLGLMNRLVESLVPEDGLVLDPFAGSGSTLRAAKECGRRAIGIEREEKYCEIAADRMSQQVLF